MATLTGANSFSSRDHRGVSRRLGGWRVPGFLAGALMLASIGQAASVAEYDLKAAFLYIFAQFVDWPPEAFPTPDAPLVIGVLGTDPFKGALDEIVRDEVVKGRRIVVAHYRNTDEIGMCHVLFIPRQGAPPVASVLSRVAGRPVLTVGEADDFVQRGGAVGFRMENRRVLLRVNLGAARAAHLTISSKLLRVSDVVDSNDLG